VEGLLPQADIVHHKFHLCAYLNKAVDMVRRVEHRQLARSGRPTLKGSKYLWLHNFPDLRFQPSFRELYRLNLRTSRAGLDDPCAMGLGGGFLGDVGHQWSGRSH
jgi:transposase